MLLHIKQTHAPEDCPYGKGGSPGLANRDAPSVKLHGYWLAFPQHTVYYVVETDDISSLQAFLKPGTRITRAEITPRQRPPGRDRLQPAFLGAVDRDAADDRGVRGLHIVEGITAGSVK